MKWMIFEKPLSKKFEVIITVIFAHFFCSTNLLMAAWMSCVVCLCTYCSRGWTPWGTYLPLMVIDACVVLSMTLVLIKV